MKKNTTYFCRLLALILSVIYISSCAIPGSNSQKLSGESFEIIEVANNDYGGGIAEIAVDAGTWGIKKLIDLESKKYTAHSEASHVTNSLFGKYFLVIRSYDEKSSESNLSIRDIYDRQKQKQGVVNELYKKSLASYLQRNPEKSDNTLSFAALIYFDEISESKMYEAQLLGYEYPLMKAKKSSISIPFTKIEDTSSIVKLTVKGPIGSSQYKGGRYKVEGGMTIDWKGAASTEGFVTEKSKYFYRAVKCSNKSLIIEVALVESSDLGGEIKKMKDEVDLESWIKKL